MTEDVTTASSKKKVAQSLSCSHQDSFDEANDFSQTQQSDQTVTENTMRGTIEPPAFVIELSDKHVESPIQKDS
jgi:hypothetical protein